MEAYLRDLRAKPPEHKKRFAFFVSLGVTLFIFVIWFFVKFGAGSEVVKGAEESVQLAAVVQGDLGFLQQIFGAIGETLGSIGDILSNGK